MGKKVKIGEVRIKRRITVTRRVTQQNEYHHDIELAASAQNAITGQVQSTVKQITRPIKLPANVYTPQVEHLYEEINKRSKPKEIENNAVYDVFISHASEDKPDFVEPLVKAFTDAGIKVWYDALELEWGKSLRAQIDNGIKLSKYAILVLSKHFFEKDWPQRELDGILVKQEVTGAEPLPIWYNISQAEVYNYSPTLAGLYSLSTDKYSIEDICHSFKLILEKEAIKES